MGVDAGALAFSFTVGRDLKLARTRPTTLGKNPKAVNAVESLTSKSREAQFFHLKATFEAHQKFATLSSNRPLLKGNIRKMGSIIAVLEARGGKNGRKRRVNVRTVMSPRRMNRRPLPRY